MLGNKSTHDWFNGKIIFFIPAMICILWGILNNDFFKNAFKMLKYAQHFKVWHSL